MSDIHHTTEYGAEYTHRIRIKMYLICLIKIYFFDITYAWMGILLIPTLIVSYKYLLIIVVSQEYDNINISYEVLRFEQSVEYRLFDPLRQKLR